MKCNYCESPATRSINLASGKVGICDACVKSIAKSKPVITSVKKRAGLPRPDEIRAFLDEYVIGQDDAKRVLAVAVHNHYKRISAGNEIEIGKSNIMMIGPTGSGKTYLARTLAKILDVPFASADATALLAKGGRDIEEILAKLVQAANYDTKQAERGIIYIDEIDKIASRYNSSGLGIQQVLLKIIEGTVAEVPLQEKRQKFSVDTSNILFIVGGAFVGLEAIVQMRQSGGVGLLELGDLIKEITPADLAKFGLIPEFIGRLPVLVGLHGLNREALKDILTKPRNALVSQYIKMFEMDGVKLEFDESALDKIADMAVSLKTGARSLRTIMEDSMRDIMYSAPSESNLKKIIITSDVIGKGGTAKLEYTHAREDTELEPLTPKPKRDKTAYSE